jgi:hypothetical protein
MEDDQDNEPENEESKEQYEDSDWNIFLTKIKLN